MTTLTTEEVLEMARQAARHNTILDRDDIVEGDLVMLYFDELEAFAKLVADKATAKAAEREREACAEICDAINAVYTKPEDAAERVASQWCAERIRARGITQV